MAKSKKPFDLDRVVQELCSFVEDAVGDVARSMLSPELGTDSGDKWYRKIQKAKKYGVSDLEGWLADELFSDVTTVEGLIGDKMYDLCNGDKEHVRQVCDRLIDRGGGQSTMARAAARVKNGL